MIRPHLSAFFHAWRFRILLGLLAGMAALYGLQSLRLAACRTGRANDALAAAERLQDASRQAVAAADLTLTRRAEQGAQTQSVIEGIRDEDVSLVCDSPAIRSAVERVWGEPPDQSGDRPR